MFQKNSLKMILSIPLNVRIKTKITYLMFSVSSVARFKIPPRSMLFIEVSSGRSKLFDESSFFLSVLSLDIFKNESQEQHVKNNFVHFNF